MSKYKLRLIHVTTKDGEEHSGGDNYWSGMDDQALAAMLGMAAKVQGAVSKAANQGGPIQTVLTMQVTALDGGAIPPGANPSPMTFTGITRHGLSDIEDAMHQTGADLKQLGRDNANKKEGPKGQHGGKGGGGGRGG